MTEPYRHGHAVVIGASMAGLLAARVLSEHFQRVTVIERDTLGEDAEPRRGVPQGRHAHLLLKRGEQILSELFPDLVTGLLEKGATPLQLGRDLRWHHFGCWKRSYSSSLSTVSLSRPLLEQEVRRRVRRLRNVTIVDGTVVTRYVADWERARLTGVCVRARHDDTLEDEVRADLVVDAGGRGSQTPQRLAELGFQRPPEALVKVDFGYASRIYEQAAGARPWKSLYVIAEPPSRRGGLLFPLEGNRWVVTLIGCHDDKPPTKEAAFMEFARSLPVPDLHAVMSTGRPQTEIVSHGFPGSQRRYYERLARFPAGLIVMGDALCSFNPIFGQGMSVSALQASLLNECLAELRARRTPNLEALTCNFRSRVGQIVETPWQMATGEDLRFPQTPGRRSLKLRALHWYTEKLHRAAGQSALVAERFHKVTHMLAPRGTLFGRDVLTELLRLSWPRPRERSQHCKSEAHQH